MENEKRFSDGIWELFLPGNWVQQEPTESGSVNFESADGSKGIFITTWDLPHDTSRTLLQVAESFKNVGVETLPNTEGVAWKVVDEQAAQYEGAAVVLVDHLAEASSYRIVTKVLTRPRVVVRAAFHDYLCEDYEASHRYFAPIVDSLNFCGLAA